MSPIQQKMVLSLKTKIKKFINAYSDKVIKIYQRCEITFQDSLGLGEPHSTKNIVLSLKVINIYTIYHIISLRCGATIIGPSEGKSQEFDLVSQYRLNLIKK